MAGASEETEEERKVREEAEQKEREAKEAGKEGRKFSITFLRILYHLHLNGSPKV